ncbi:MAG: prepilin-type N-terminal cleavage/methylation domain-containing protein [Spirochaetia bacterium]|nr:prepilin-type N-terminal cleavage/methylation domain-containing protein [Spirochaetia bacterium]
MSVRFRKGLTLIELSVVMFVMSIIIVILGSLYSRFSLFKSTQDEATLLRDSLSFARSAAIRSNEIIYVQFNLDEETYRAFRKQSGEKDEIIEKDLIKVRNLSSGNSIVAIQVGSTMRQNKGKVDLRMYPDGSSEELMILMGPDPEIKNTVLFSRYGKAQVLDCTKGPEAMERCEAGPASEDPSWRHNMEEM